MCWRRLDEPGDGSIPLATHDAPKKPRKGRGSSSSRSSKLQRLREKMEKKKMEKKASRKSAHEARNAPVGNAHWGGGVSYPTSTNIVWFSPTGSRPAESMQDTLAQAPLPCPPRALKPFEFMGMHGRYGDGCKVNTIRPDEESPAAGSGDVYTAGATFAKQKNRRCKAEERARTRRWSFGPRIQTRLKHMQLRRALRVSLMITK